MFPNFYCTFTDYVGTTWKRTPGSMVYKKPVQSSDLGERSGAPAIDFNKRVAVISILFTERVARHWSRQPREVV